MYWIYKIRSTITHEFYTGLSKNIPERLAEHNSGKVKSTRHGIPWKLVYAECGYVDGASARKREIYMKSAAGRKWFMKQFLK